MSLMALIMFQESAGFPSPIPSMADYVAFGKQSRGETSKNTKTGKELADFTSSFLSTPDYVAFEKQSRGENSMNIKAANVTMNTKTAKMDICRAKKLSRMTEKLSENLLVGVVTVSDGVTAPVVGSKVGQKFFRMLPGDVLLASLDAFKKVLDAAEVVGRDALSVASEATVEIVANMYCVLNSSCLGRKQER